MATSAFVVKAAAVAAAHFGTAFATANGLHRCQFVNEPVVPYYWDPECVLGMLGCWADGVSVECRFCGDAPYTNITCPEGAGAPPASGCSFDAEPEITYNLDPTCEEGMLGCNADGKNIHCRFCGQGDYAEVPCDAAQKCQFANEPTVPYFWDPKCWKDDADVLGCLADGIHKECRFCSARPFESVLCPSDVAPKEGVCTFPIGSDPLIASYWDPTCELGMLGCWADGIHAECRFCGGNSVYSEIVCPDFNTTTTVTVFYP